MTRRRHSLGHRAAARIAAGKPVRLEDLPCPSEHDEQVMLIRELRAREYLYPELAEVVAIPNGGLRSKATGGKLKAEGTARGYPDLLLDVPRHGFHGLRVEMKRLRGGMVSPEQRVWLDRLERRGYAVRVCRGHAKALEVFLWYIRLPLRGVGS